MDLTECNECFTLDKKPAKEKDMEYSEVLQMEISCSVQKEDDVETLSVSTKRPRDTVKGVGGATADTEWSTKVEENL